MEKQIWIKRLTSRKFLTMVTGVITAILVALNIPEPQLGQIIAIVGGFATMIAYIFGEGMVDAAAVAKGGPDESN